MQQEELQVYTADLEASDGRLGRHDSHRDSPAVPQLRVPLIISMSEYSRRGLERPAKTQCQHFQGTILTLRKIAI